MAAVSEAPWWWRERLPPAETDLAEARPLMAETWLAGLHQAGFKGSATYAPDGHSYAVLAWRERAAEPS